MFWLGSACYQLPLLHIGGCGGGSGQLPYTMTHDHVHVSSVPYSLNHGIHILNSVEVSINSYLWPKPY